MAADLQTPSAMMHEVAEEVCKKRHAHIHLPPCLHCRLLVKDVIGIYLQKRAQ